MTEDAELKGLNPFDLLDQEAARIERYFSSGLSEAELARPSRCEGWSVRDVLAHLRSAEEYHQACLDGRVADVLRDLAARGGHDLDSANAVWQREQAGKPVAQLLDEWKALNADTRRRFRERGDGVVDTSVGDYPSRWQAFHVASELATHADDAYVPVDDAERDRRRYWRAKFSRFALAEAKPDVSVDVNGPHTRVSGGGVMVEVDDDTLIEGVMARLPENGPLDLSQRRLLSTMPS